MADPVDLTSISNSLSQVFMPMLVRQINRKQGLLTLLPKRVGAGKNLAWVPEFDGAVAAGGAADGSDIGAGEYGADDTLPATLGWGNYRGAFRVGAMAQAAARTSHSPAELRALFRSKLFGVTSKMGDVLNKDLFTGDGTADTINGIGTVNGPLDSVGTYATIVRGTTTDWQGNHVVADAPLTQTMMRTAIRTIFTRCGEYPDVICCDPVTWDAYGELLDANRRPTYQITTRAGMIEMRGGWRALEFDGIPVIRDKDCPAETMFFINTNYLYVEFLPTVPGQQNDADTDLFMVHDETGKVNGLPARINMLGRTGQADKAYIDIFPQVKSTRPNAHYWLNDFTTGP